ncbi:MAG TPA: membrane dipeptidase [Rectinemataceae bacterium]|nr:membrane dipeptidase [Rectinemataceae bacterium]
MHNSPREEIAGEGFLFPVIDAHCDALLAVIGKSQIPGDTGRRDFLIRNEMSHIDLPKLLAGGVRCQFMALFAEDEDLPQVKEYTHGLIDEFETICAKSEGGMFAVKDASDLDKAQPGKSVGGLLSIEGAEALEGHLDSVDEFYGRGVRAIGITWNRRNAFGRGVRAEGEDGLTPLGRELVEKMESMGMIVDCSHLSDAAFDDLAQVAKRPFIASHSNARSLNSHPRNLEDRQIRRIAEGGGAVGVVFVPNFVSMKPEKTFLEHLVDHIDHIVRVGGMEAAALGSDFDGYRGIEGHVLVDASEFPLLARALARRGYAPGQIEKIFSKNWERVIREIL